MDAISSEPAASVRLNTVSTVEAAANALRELILDGELEPGARLREAEFAERLGIARHTFRAATQILIAEGMLRREPHRGVQVTVLTAADILDTFRLRAALEVEAVRIAIAAGRIPDEARQAVDDLSAVPDGRSLARRWSNPTWASTAPSSTPPAASGSRAPTAESRPRSCSAWSSCAPTTSVRRRSPPSTRSCSPRSTPATPSHAEELFRAPPHRGGREPEQRRRIWRGRERRGGDRCEESVPDHRHPRPRGARLPRAADRPGRPRARGRRDRARPTSRPAARPAPTRPTSCATAASASAASASARRSANVTARSPTLLVGKPLPDQRTLDRRAGRARRHAGQVPARRQRDPRRLAGRRPRARPRPSGTAALPRAERQRPRPARCRWST